MSDNRNIELARRMIDAMDMGDLRAIDELVHPDHRDHAAEEELTGRDGVRRTMEWIHETFGEPHTEIQDLIASGDRVVARAMFSAHQIGELGACRRRAESSRQSTSTSGGWPTACSPSTGWFAEA